MSKLTKETEDEWAYRSYLNRQKKVSDKRLRTIIQMSTKRRVRCPVCKMLVRAYKLKSHMKKQHRGISDSHSRTEM